MMKWNYSFTFNAEGGVGNCLMKYKQRKDCEGFEVPSGTIYRIACCDCGLVHDFVFVSQDGKPIGIAAKRNNRATAQRRRHVTPNTRVQAAAEGGRACNDVLGTDLNGDTNGKG